MAAFPRPTLDTFAFRQALAEFYKQNPDCSARFYEMAPAQVSSILRRAQEIKKELQGKIATSRMHHRLRRLL